MLIFGNEPEPGRELDKKDERRGRRVNYIFDALFYFSSFGLHSSFGVINGARGGRCWAGEEELQVAAFKLISPSRYRLSF